MVEIFKTSVTESETAHSVVLFLHQKFPGNRINFDLSDADNILRIEGENINTEEILHALNGMGHICEIMN